ncbi:MAG TPA: VOC family protein [Kofleriaceae bacterium]|nr:VOC family protein [Kofleriaceae bacterium]
MTEPIAIDHLAVDHLAIDHLAIAAATLDDGLAYVRDALGVDLPTGGAHPRMATHNRVLRLGAACYLEVIAIDPGAPPPARPRWFGLDDAALQAELRRSPRLLTWVVRTPDIAGLARASRVPLGAVEPMTRGDLHWQITIPADGALVDHGAIPSLIAWPAGPHPASRMPDLGCSLERFTIAHPDPARLRADLAAIGAGREVTITAGPKVALRAGIGTPSGIRTLG